MALVIKGKIEKILSEEKGVSRAGNQWVKQEFVIETIDQYPKKVCFTLFNDKVGMASNVKPGDEVEVSFDVESREYNGKYYHSLNAWKIDKTSAGKVNDGYLPPHGPDDVPPELADDGSDLPF